MILKILMAPAPVDDSKCLAHVDIHYIFFPSCDTSIKYNTMSAEF